MKLLINYNFGEFKYERTCDSCANFLSTLLFEI